MRKTYEIKQDPTNSGGFMLSICKNNFFEKLEKVLNNNADSSLSCPFCLHKQLKAWIVIKFAHAQFNTM